MDYELFYGSLQISFSASVVESNSIVSRSNTNFFAKYQPTEFPWHLMLQQDTSCVLGSVGKTIFLIVHCWIICAVLFLFHSCLQDELFLMTENTFLYHPWSDSAGISFFCDASNKCINIWFGRMEKYITYTKKNQHIFFNSSCLWQSYHITKLPTWHIKVE